MQKTFRSGFVAILGRPNVGKSSLMNRFVGEKVAIVSDHPQTTRNKLLGVATGEDWQIVFVDTPGLHKPRTKLGEFMMKSAEEAREGVDAVLAVVDGQRIGDGDRAVLADVAQMKCPKFLAVNKIDLVTPEKLMPQLATLTGCGFDTIVSVSEIIREKALRNLRDEIPHGVGVEMLQIKKVSDTLTEIHADVYCERASHKSIIIGRQGAMLRKIGSEARVDIERLLGTKVMLKLWVKVREGWRNREGDLRALGYEE